MTTTNEQPQGLERYCPPEIRAEFDRLNTEGRQIVDAAGEWLRRVGIAEHSVDVIGNRISDQLRAFEEATDQKFDTHVYDGMRRFLAGISGADRARGLALDLLAHVERLDYDGEREVQP